MNPIILSSMVPDFSAFSREELIEKIESLSGSKKFGIVWEESSEEIVEKCASNFSVVKFDSKKSFSSNPLLPTHMLIEGDNYHALSALQYTHAGKIDCIYIDPPYNTGAKDWIYNNNFVDINDTYRHSRWLSMMKHRLLLAKKLLKEDGVIICAIDENEFNRLGLLLEEVFASHELHCVTIVHNPRGIQGRNFSYTHEYAYFSFQRGLNAIGPRKIESEDIDWRNLRDNGGESLRTDAKTCFYPIIVEKGKIVGFGEVMDPKKHPKGQIEVHGKQEYIYPIDKNGIERKWRYARDSVPAIQHLLRAKKTGSTTEIEIGKDFGTVRTVWQDSRYDANQWGTKLVQALVPGNEFDFPKSLWTTYDCIAPVLRSKKNAIVLDFFAGSGTTGHAVSVLNAEDNGNRQFILCTNNDNKIAENVTYKRIKAIQKSNPSFSEITGIPISLAYFRTEFVTKTSNFDEDATHLSPLATDLIRIKENVFNEEISTDFYQVFSSQEKLVAVYHDLVDSRLQELVEYLSKDEREKVLYLFSLSDTGEVIFDFDYDPSITVIPYPDVLLEVN